MTRRSGRSRARVCALIAVIAVALAGCGVPSSGQPIADGPPPARNSTNDGGNVISAPAPSNYAFNQVNAYFATGYLDSVAGQVGAKAQEDAARTFMTTGLRKSWKVPNPQISVVRVKDVVATPTPTTDGYVVNVHVLVVGLFDPQSGSLAPPPSNAPATLAFQIEFVGGTMLLAKAPDGMYMNEDALHESEYFTSQLIYFWDQDGGLIPDLRYQPASLSPIQRATAVVKWILAGPPAWMAGVAVPATPDVQLVDNTLPTKGNVFYVSLNSAARALQPVQQTDLLTQIRWSLGSIRAGASSSPASAVQLGIPNQQNRIDDDPYAYVTRNQAAGRTTDPTAYAIDGEKVRPIQTVKGAAIPVLPAGSPNTHVMLAAIDSAQDRAAFVRDVGGHEELWLRRGTKTVGPIEMGGGTSATSFQRPVWLTLPAGALAFVADGRFYILPAGKDRAVRVTVPNLTSVGPFSVAPDGRQVAFVADGELWTSLLETGTSPSAASPPSLTAPRLLSVQPALNSVTAVAWSAVDQIVVGGVNDKGAATIELYVDGTYTNSDPQLTSFGDLTISQVVSYPFSANVSLAGSPDVMVQLNTYACGGRADCQHLVWNPPSTTAPPPTSPFYPD